MVNVVSEPIITPARARPSSSTSAINTARSASGIPRWIGEPSSSAKPATQTGSQRTIKKRAHLGERIDVDNTLSATHSSQMSQSSVAKVKLKPKVVSKRPSLPKVVASRPRFSAAVIPTPPARGSGQDVVETLMPRPPSKSTAGGTPHPKASLPRMSMVDETMLMDVTLSGLNAEFLDTDASEAEDAIWNSGVRRSAQLGRVGGLMTPANSQEVSAGSPRRPVPDSTASSSKIKRNPVTRLPTPPSSQTNEAPTPPRPSTSRIHPRPTPTPPRRLISGAFYSKSPSQDPSPNPRRKKSPRTDTNASHPEPIRLPRTSLPQPQPNRVEIVITPRESLGLGKPRDKGKARARSPTRTPSATLSQSSTTTTPGGITIRTLAAPSTAPPAVRRPRPSIAACSRKRASTPRTVQSKPRSKPSPPKTAPPRGRSRSRQSLTPAAMQALAGRQFGITPRPVEGSPGDDPLLLVGWEADFSVRKQKPRASGVGLRLGQDQSDAGPSTLKRQRAMTQRKLPTPVDLSAIPSTCAFTDLSVEEEHEVHDLTLHNLSQLKEYHDGAGSYDFDDGFGSDSDVDDGPVGGDDTFVHVLARREFVRSGSERARTGTPLVIVNEASADVSHISASQAHSCSSPMFPQLAAGEESSLSILSSPVLSNSSFTTSFNPISLAASSSFSEAGYVTFSLKAQDETLPAVAFASTEDAVSLQLAQLTEETKPGRRENQGRVERPEVEEKEVTGDVTWNAGQGEWNIFLDRHEAARMPQTSAVPEVVVEAEEEPPIQFMRDAGMEPLVAETLVPIDASVAPSDDEDDANTTLDAEEGDWNISLERNAELKASTAVTKELDDTIQESTPEPQREVSSEGPMAEEVRFNVPLSVVGTIQADHVDLTDNCEQHDQDSPEQTSAAGHIGTAGDLDPAAPHTTASEAGHDSEDDGQAEKTDMTDGILPFEAGADIITRMDKASTVSFEQDIGPLEEQPNASLYMPELQETGDASANWVQKELMEQKPICPSSPLVASNNVVDETYRAELPPASPRRQVLLDLHITSFLQSPLRSVTTPRRALLPPPELVSPTKSQAESDIDEEVIEAEEGSNSGDITVEAQSEDWDLSEKGSFLVAAQQEKDGEPKEDSADDTTDEDDAASPEQNVVENVEAAGEDIKKTAERSTLNALGLFEDTNGANPEIYYIRNDQGGKEEEEDRNADEREGEDEDQSDPSDLDKEKAQNEDDRTSSPSASSADGRIVLKLVSSGIVKLEPEEPECSISSRELFAPPLSSHTAVPAAQEPAEELGTVVRRTSPNSILLPALSVTSNGRGLSDSATTVSLSPANRRNLNKVPCSRSAPAEPAGLSPPSEHGPLDAQPTAQSTTPLLPPVGLPTSTSSSTPVSAPPPVFRHVDSNLGGVSSLERMLRRNINASRMPSRLSQQITGDAPNVTPGRLHEEENKDAPASAEDGDEKQEGNQSVLLRSASKSLYDELAAADGDTSINSVVEVSSLDPRAAARAAAILKLNHAYIEHGVIQSPFSPRKTPRRRSVHESAFFDTIDSAMKLTRDELLHEAELEIVAGRRGRSASVFSTMSNATAATAATGYSELPLPGGWVRTPKRKRSRPPPQEMKDKRLAPKTVPPVDSSGISRGRGWGVPEWKKLEKVFRAEREAWVKEREIKPLPGGLVGWARVASVGPPKVVEWDGKRVTNRFLNEEGVKESEGEWSRETIALRVKALERRVLSKTDPKSITAVDQEGSRSPKKAKSNDMTVTPRPSTTMGVDVPIQPPSTIKKALNWIWGWSAQKPSGQAKKTTLATENVQEAVNEDEGSENRKESSIERTEHNMKQLPSGRGVTAGSSISARPPRTPAAEVFWRQPIQRSFAPVARPSQPTYSEAHPASASMTPPPPPPPPQPLPTSLSTGPPHSLTTLRSAPLELTVSTSSTATFLHTPAARLYPALDPPLTQRSSAIKALFPDIHPLGSSTSSTASESSSTSRRTPIAIPARGKPRESVRNMVRSFEDKKVLERVMQDQNKGGEVRRTSSSTGLRE